VVQISLSRSKPMLRWYTPESIRIERFIWQDEETWLGHILTSYQLNNSYYAGNHHNRYVWRLLLAAGDMSRARYL
jgi:hypothetical protein